MGELKEEKTEVKFNDGAKEKFLDKIYENEEKMIKEIKDFYHDKRIIVTFR